MSAKQATGTPLGCEQIPHSVSSGNVFSDLGVDDPAAALLKADVARRIAGAIRSRGISQTAAAKLLGTDQPKVSALLRGRLTGFSIERLLRYAAALDQDVEVLVRSRRQSTSHSPPGWQSGSTSATGPEAREVRETAETTAYAAEAGEASETAPVGPDDLDGAERAARGAAERLAAAQEEMCRHGPYYDPALPSPVEGHGPAHPAGKAARELGRLVAAYREAYGLTQAGLGQRLGWPQPNVARLEAGQRTPDLATLDRLARRLGLVVTVRATPSGMAVELHEGADARAAPSDRSG